MAGLIVDAAEGTRMFIEIGTYAAYGLLEEDPDVKQFFFERIILTLGIGLAPCREQMGATVGKVPDYLDMVEKSLERIKP